MYDQAIKFNKYKMDSLQRGFEYYLYLGEYFHVRFKYMSAIKMYDMALKLDP